MDLKSTDIVLNKSSQIVPTLMIFEEATGDQRRQCDTLAASAFGHPLSKAEFLEREAYMSEQELARNTGIKTWCLYCGNGMGQVLAACKTIKRELLITDHRGAQRKLGYCVVSVVTHPDYRGQGLATELLRNVAQLLDIGGAAASMLYSNKEDVSMRGGGGEEY